MSKAHRSKYKPKNMAKYAGNIDMIICRSSWERAVCQWCDLNPSVIKWSSEEVIVPYICKTDNSPHRYFIDFKIQMKNGKTYLIEVKPDKQTKKPKQPQRKSPKYKDEVLTYVKNLSKWNAAKKYCEDREWTFMVWTENTLNKMGIRVI